MQNQDQNKKKTPNWVGFALVLLFTAPEVAIPIGIIAGIVYLVTKNTNRKPKASEDIRDITYTRKAEVLDDCPRQLFCFHKDKGEHHVSRGKEIDPWDRPDIDISKYQRKR